ncbi:MAG: hypothetical protein OHK0039_15440 [Bacteroidia bacterium]
MHLLWFLLTMLVLVYVVVMLDHWPGMIRRWVNARYLTGVPTPPPRVLIPATVFLILLQVLHLGVWLVGFSLLYQAARHYGGAYSIWYALAGIAGCLVWWSLVEWGLFVRKASPLADGPYGEADVYAHRARQQASLRQELYSFRGGWLVSLVFLLIVATLLGVFPVLRLPFTPAWTGWLF